MQVDDNMPMYLGWYLLQQMMLAAMYQLVAYAAGVEGSEV